MAKSILFDLDGTLTDPGMGITNSAMYALEQLHLPVPPRTELYKFIGPPLRDSFREFYGMNDAEADEAIRLFRVYFADRGLHENELYEGVVPMLKALDESGFHLVLATSKPEQWAKVILDHFGLSRYIRDAAGATMDHSRSAKADVIAYALERFGVDPADAVMVGDRKHDMEGGRANGLPGVGVTYGYGDRAELTAAGAAAIADTPAELLTILMGGTF